MKPKTKIKRKDHVNVITGRDKGKSGTVMKIMVVKKQTKAIVKGINVIEKSTGARFETPIHISNICLSKKY